MNLKALEVTNATAIMPHAPRQENLGRKARKNAVGSAYFPETSVGTAKCTWAPS